MKVFALVFKQSYLSPLFEGLLRVGAIQEVVGSLVVDFKVGCVNVERRSLPLLYQLIHLSENSGYHASILPGLTPRHRISLP